MSSELTHRQGGGQMSALGGDVEGLEEARPEHVQVPRLILRQGTSKDVPDEVRLGSWYMRTVGRNYGPLVTFVPIAMFASRVYFAKNDPKPQCSSHDAVKPNLREGDSAPQSPAAPDGSRASECDRCWFAQWQPNPDAPGKNWQPCAAQISFLGFALPDGAESDEDRQLCTVTFKRRSWKAGRQIITTLKTAGVKTISDVVFKLGSVVESGAMTKYAIATASKTAYQTQTTYPDAYMEAGHLRAGWKQMRSRFAAEATVEGAQDEEVVESPVANAEASNAAGKHVIDDDLPF